MTLYIVHVTTRDGMRYYYGPFDSASRAADFAGADTARYSGVTATVEPLIPYEDPEYAAAEQAYRMRRADAAVVEEK